MWSPEVYARYRDERHRPFHELVARIDARDARHVVDLGCGDGALTATLADRLAAARVLGVDSSPEMIAAAERSEGPAARLRAEGRLAFLLGDLAAFTSATPLDLVVANASLQWVDDHEHLLARLAALVAPGGTLAYQVPANVDAPSHVILRELLAEPRWAARVGGAARRAWPCLPTERALELLAGLGFVVDAWETTYFHVLEGDDPVLAWTSGTALRPALAALDAAAADELRADYGARLRAAYPRRAFGTVFPFRRHFVVARRPRA